MSLFGGSNKKSGGGWNVNGNELSLNSKPTKQNKVTKTDLEDFIFSVQKTYIEYLNRFSVMNPLIAYLALFDLQYAKYTSKEMAELKSKNDKNITMLLLYAFWCQFALWGMLFPKTQSYILLLRMRKSNMIDEKLTNEDKYTLRYIKEHLEYIEFVIMNSLDVSYADIYKPIEKTINSTTIYNDTKLELYEKGDMSIVLSSLKEKLEKGVFYNEANKLIYEIIEENVKRID